MLRLATRGSQLALWQASHIGRLLQVAHPGLEVEIVPVVTAGDRRSDVPVREMAGRGVFVREVQAAVLDGKAEAAVHSAKDLQPVSEPGLCLAAVPARGDPRDALVGSHLSALARGAVVATGSQRRRAQLAAVRPDLSFQSLRGNIGTRLSRVPPGGAIVVAMAALARLGLSPEPLEALSCDVMLPQVAQGAIAVECRCDDHATIQLARPIEDPRARQAVDAERAFLAAIGGGCDLPVAGYAALGATGRLKLEGLLASTDGSVIVRRSASSEPGDDVAGLGEKVAGMVLSSGGSELLASYRGHK